MECKPVIGKWADSLWEAVAVVSETEDDGAGARRIFQEGRGRWLFPGLFLRLHGDEAENYPLKIGAPQLRVFVIWRLEQGLARPLQARRLAAWAVR